MRRIAVTRPAYGSVPWTRIGCGPIHAQRSPGRTMFVPAFGAAALARIARSSASRRQASGRIRTLEQEPRFAVHRPAHAAGQGTAAAAVRRRRRAEGLAIGSAASRDERRDHLIITPMRTSGGHTIRRPRRETIARVTGSRRHRPRSGTKTTKTHEDHKEPLGKESQRFFVDLVSFVAIVPERDPWAVPGIYCAPRGNGGGRGARPWRSVR